MIKTILEIWASIAFILAVVAPLLTRKFKKDNEDEASITLLVVLWPLILMALPFWLTTHCVFSLTEYLDNKKLEKENKIKSIVV